MRVFDWLPIALILSAGAWLPAQTGRSDEVEVGGQEVTTPRLSPAQVQRVSELVKLMDSEDFGVRDSAATELESLGAAIRPHLLRALDKSTLELRLRLESILERFPESIEAVKVDLEPTRVSLSLDRGPVTAIFDAIEQRCGIRIDRARGFDPATVMSLDLQRQPILRAIDELADRLGARWTRDPRTGLLRFQAGAVGKSLRHYTGPFRISLTSVSHNSNLFFGGEARENCYLQSQIDVEPDTGILGMWLPPTLSVVKDDKGRSLLDATKVISSFNPAAMRSSFHTSLRFAPPERDALKLSKLEGRVLVAVPAEYEVATLPIPEAGSETETRSAGMTVRLKNLQSLPTATTITVEIERAPVYAGDDRRRPIRDQIFEFHRAMGEPVQPSRAMPAQIRGEVEVFNLRLEKGQYQRLVLRCLTKMVTRKIAFEFHDIPLP